MGCVLGIDAGGAEEEKLLDAMGVGFRDDIALDLHVHHDEVGTIEHIGHDAADKGCGKDYGIGALFIEEATDSDLIG